VSLFKHGNITYHFDSNHAIATPCRWVNDVGVNFDCLYQFLKYVHPKYEKYELTMIAFANKDLNCVVYSDNYSDNNFH
jgi:hypothetical protein